jgi:type II secretory pathway pseudopilin PulG
MYAVTDHSAAAGATSLAPAAPVSRPRPFPARHPRRRRFAAGLGLVEAMVALAICATLLTAVAAAFSAAAQAVNENDEFFLATQGGRVALNRILTQARRGTVANTSTATELTLITDTGLLQKYTIDLAPLQKNIKLTITTNGVQSTYVLARTVSAGSFAYETGTDYDGNPCITRVVLTLTVENDNNRMVFSGSATCRAVIKY